MKRVCNNRCQPGNATAWSPLLLIVFLPFLLLSCFAQQSYIGRATLPQHILTLEAEEEEKIWQTDDIFVSYMFNVEDEEPLILSGTLSASDAMLRTFPTVKRLSFHIHYLDEQSRVISSQPIGINHGYKNKRARDLKFREIVVPPAGTAAVTFSYFGIMTGLGTSDLNPGEWEIYFHPFRAEGEEDQPTKDLFYRE